jgi:hypothetical protein
MHFPRLLTLTTTLLLTSAATATAEPTNLAPNDLSVFDRSLSRVSNALSSFDNALRTIPAFRDAADADFQVNTLLTYSGAVINELRNGAQDIRRGPNINTLEAISLPVKVDSLQRQLQSVITGVVRIKNRAVAAGKKLWVLDELQQASAATAGFFDATLTRLGPLEQSLTLSTKQQFLRIIDAAILEYRR